mgnify:FL=1
MKLVRNTSTSVLEQSLQNSLERFLFNSLINEKLSRRAYKEIEDHVYDDSVRSLEKRKET